MALFGFGKKKEDANIPTCTCNGGCEVVEAEVVESTGNCCGTAVNGICCVKVLGSGCKNCHALLEASKEAVKNIGLNIEVEYVTDMEKIMEYGVMSMPALVVNEKAVSAGKVLKAAEVEKILRKYGG